jgi:hypothetical protein
VLASPVVSENRPEPGQEGILTFRQYLDKFYPLKKIDEVPD